MKLDVAGLTVGVGGTRLENASGRTVRPPHASLRGSASPGCAAFEGLGVEKQPHQTPGLESSLETDRLVQKLL